MKRRFVTPLPLVWGMFTHQIPVGARYLAAGWEGGKPLLWIEFGVEEGQEPETQPRAFRCVHSQDEIPAGMEYIDSLYSFSGNELLHLYGDPS